MRSAAVRLFAIYAIATLGVSISGLFGLHIPPIVTILLTALGFTFALLHGAVFLGWKRVLLLVGLTFGVSLLFESVGVATGLIYGPYHYTDKLGPKFLGLVPYLIPLAWFMMLYPSLLIAAHLVPENGRPVQRGLAVAALGALIMTAWDLAMDPFMVLIGHWVWDVPGDYFGIPLQNYLGWWVTTFVTLGLYLLIAKTIPTTSSGESWSSFGVLAVYVYAINGLNSMLTDFNLGLAGPALVGFFAMLPWVLLALFSQQNPDNPQPS
jgi:uncharacterized membrane protein